MKQYNIYAGLNGSFGGAKYQYTGLYDTVEEAVEEAFQEACEIYDQYEELYHLYSWKDAIKEYCNNNDVDIENLDSEDYQEIEDYYNEGRESWLKYYVISTDEDEIDLKDLILSYVIKDDSASQIDSK